MSDDAPTADDYAVLGLAAGATVEEIDRAYRQQRALYAEDSLATYALLDPEARARHLEGIEDAHRRLKLAVSAAPPAPAAPSPPGDGAASPAPPVARGEAPEEDLEAPGATLAALRAWRGLPLSELARRTRIRTAYLEALEAEDHPALPALVYVRGFVQQVARELGARRAEALAQAFAERCRAARGE